MARPPQSPPGRAPFDGNVEETLSFDHARWSGFRDGFGERENGVDEQGFSIELLRLRKEFNPLALALTDRILRLIDFDRTGATRALRVDQDENSPRLVLVSERAPGFRLSELLERGAERGIIADLGAALFVMRRLLATAAAVQRETGVTQLAIAPERIVITPRGDAVVVEAALAGAIEAFGDKLPAAVRKASRLARIDAGTAGAQTDIARVALAGMAMLVGRPLDPAADVDPLSPIVQEVVEVAALRGGDYFAAALTPWLDRAITIDPELSFADFGEASDALDGIVPPAESRCSVSRAPLRRFLKDLVVDESHRAHLEALEGDRVLEIRARQIRSVPAFADLALLDAGAAVGDADAVEDPVAAIMDMPVAVEELSTEILNHPLAVDDVPSVMADEVVSADMEATVDDTVFAAPEVEEPTPAEHYFIEPSVDDELPIADTVDRMAEDTSAGDEPYAYDAPADEPSLDETSVSVLDPLDYGITVDEVEQPTLADPSLDDLVDEILRRGVEPVLPEYSDGDELLEEFPSPLDRTPSFDGSNAYQYADLAEESLEVGEPPVEEPPEQEPPVDEPTQEEPPADEPPPYEPPVDEPPQEAPPIQEPATRVSDAWHQHDEHPADPAPEDETPAEEPAPLWMRAAIEQMARSRQDRPATAPPRHEPRAPVFVLPDEPERERQAETTTLSDIAKEMGITIERPHESPPEAAWDARQDAALVEEEAIDEEGWDEEIRALPVVEPPAGPPAPIPQTTFPPYVPAPPPSFELPRPAPPPSFELPRPAPPLPSFPAYDPEPDLPAPAAGVRDPKPQPVETPERTPLPSFGDRMPELRESGRFVRIAATIAFVVAALGAAGYGGWRYYGSITAPGTLVVESTPPGSEVTIDGAASGTTPVTMELPPGSHAIELTRRGVTRRFTIDVRPGEATTHTLDWSTIRPTGSLAVATNPQGAKVSVAGRDYGVTPVTIPNLPVGRHTVVLEASGGTVRRQVTIEADATATLDEAIFSGWIAVFAPVELQILAGTRVLGTSENGRIMVPAGRYELTLINKELGARLTRAVEVEPGKVAAINITEVPAAPPPPPPSQP